VEQIEEGQWLLSPNPRGFYPYFGSSTRVRASRSEQATGSTWATNRMLTSARCDAFSNSTLFEAAFVSPNHFGDRVDVGGSAGRRDARAIGYYGLGMDSDAARSNVDLTQTYVDGFVAVRPRRWFEFRAAAAYENFDEQESTRDPAIGAVHTPISAPRLGDAPSYLHGQVSGAILWQQSPG
jgi:hypothetical protein